MFPCVACFCLAHSMHHMFSKCQVMTRSMSLCCMCFYASHVFMHRIFLCSCASYVPSCPFFNVSFAFLDYMFLRPVCSCGSCGSMRCMVPCVMCFFTTYIQCIFWFLSVMCPCHVFLRVICFLALYISAHPVFLCVTLTYLFIFTCQMLLCIMWYGASCPFVLRAFTHRVRSFYASRAFISV